jgi:DNA-binding NtrC family response regulator
MRHKKLKLLMAEEQDDIFVLYRDYFRSIGHKVIYSSQIIDDLMANLEKNLPDICILDYKFPKSGNGLDAATKILKQYPAMPILFISAYEHLLKKMETIPFFQDKKFSVLIKPVMLAKIEEEILRLTNIR